MCHTQRVNELLASWTVASWMSARVITDAGGGGGPS